MSRETKAALFAVYKEVFLLLLFRVNVPPKTLQFIGYYYSSFLYMTSKKKVTSMKNLAHTKVILKTWLFDVNTASYDVITYQNISLPMKNILFSASFNLKLDFQLLLYSLHWNLLKLVLKDKSKTSQKFLHKVAQYIPLIWLSYLLGNEKDSLNK